MRAGKALADGLSTKIGGASAAIGQKLRTAFSRLTVGNIDIGLGRLLFALNDLPGKAADAVARMRGAFDTLRSTVGGVAGGIQQRLTNAWRAAASGATGSWQRITGGVTGTLATITGRVRAFGSTVQTGLTAPFRAFAGWMQKSMPATWGQLNIGLQLVRRRAASTAAGLRASFGGFASWIGSHLPAAFNRAMRAGVAAIQKIGPVASALAATITGTLSASLNGVRAAAETAGAAIQAMYGNFIPVLGPIFNFVRGGISSIIGLAGRLGGALLSPLSMLKNFVMSWRGMLAGLGVSLGAAGIGKYIVGSFADAEKAQVAFTTMLGGSEEAAKRLLGELQKLGDTTPLELPELRDAAKTLLAMGTNAEDVTDNLRMIGDVATGVNVPIGHIAQIWGKVSLSNKVQGEELRQLSENGIPIVSELAKKYGVTTEAIYGMGEAGQISFRDLEETFGRLTGEGGRFHGMMAKIGQTMGGRWSTLKDTIRAIAVQIGGAMAPALKKALDFGIRFTDGLKSRIGPLQDAMVRFAERVSNGVVAIGSALAWVMPIGTQLIDTTMAGFSAIADMAAAAARTIGDVFGVQLGNLQTSLVGALQGVEFAFENWRTLFAIAGERIAIFGQNAWAHIEAFAKNSVSAVRILAEEWRATIDVMLGILEGFGKNVRSLFTAIKDWMMGGDFNWEKTPLLEGAEAAIERLRQKFQQAFLAPATIKSTPTLDALQNELNRAAEVFDKMKQAQRRNSEAMSQAAGQPAAAANGQGNGGQQMATPPKELGKAGEHKFAFMGMEEFWKNVQSSISGKSDPAVVAKQQLDVNKKQLAIMQREEAARNNACNRGGVAVFG
ncbi:MAG: hypothetical protein B7Z73_09380 [Planctomycetia bacterium 21-64-5]|nr:MAG: hypothetical protein B7Z73_09380 [Planctomycetia bacterium 21-64-5]